MGSLHELKLHEKIEPSSNFCAIRVPGGWIYRFFELHQESDMDEYGQRINNYVIDSIFVPFSNEFNV